MPNFKVGMIAVADLREKVSMEWIWQLSLRLRPICWQGASFISRSVKCSQTDHLSITKLLTNNLLFVSAAFTHTILYVMWNKAQYVMSSKILILIDYYSVTIDVQCKVHKKLVFGKEILKKLRSSKAKWKGTSCCSWKNACIWQEVLFPSKVPFRNLNRSLLACLVFALYPLYL